MTFTIDNDGRFIMGSKKSSFGRFTNTAGSSGGEVVTGLNSVGFMKLTHTGSGVIAGEPSVYETFPMTKGDATIVTTADADGLWWAIGD